jgi:hypothetical protein
MADSCMMGGKKMVFDRGRFKEAINVGSRSAMKGAGGVSKVMSPKSPAEKWLEGKRKEAIDRSYRTLTPKEQADRQANRNFSKRVTQEYKATPVQKMAKAGQAVGQTVRSNVNLAREKVQAALQKQGVPYKSTGTTSRAQEAKKYDRAAMDIKKFDRIKNEFRKLRKV